jgi:hypothetical protein
MDIYVSGSHRLKAEEFGQLVNAVKALDSE